MKLLIRKILAQGMHYSGALRGLRVADRQPWRILMYHRVVRPEECSYSLHPGMYVRPETFRMQMRFLSKSCNVVSLDHLVDLISSGGRIPEGTVAITFDDGWSDNYHNAFPILKKCELPATIFLATDFVDSTGKAWKELGLTREKIEEEKLFLNWEQIKEMEEGKVVFGSHSHKHLKYSEITKDEIAFDYRLSVQNLENHKLNHTNTFCYPGGFYNQESQLALANLEVKNALKVGPSSELDKNPALLGRIGIHEDISNTPSLFHARIWGRGIF